MIKTKRLIVVPRWSGTTASDWYPWLTQMLANSDQYSPVIIGDMPQPDTPTFDNWPPAIKQIAGTDNASLASTVLVGHSVGCQAILHYLQGLDDRVRIGALLCVAGWWDVDHPWESIRPWIANAHDFERLRLILPRVHVLLSDNDPFTCDYEKNTRLWRERLGAEVQLVPGEKHFNSLEAPSVLKNLIALSSTF